MARTKLALGAVLLVFVLAFIAWSVAPREREKPTLGLMTSLPIYWSEAGSIEDMLAQEGEPHWVRTRLEEDFRLVPLDSLAVPGSAGEISERLAPLERLLLAQPAALPPADLVALDNWVRGGGRLLLFADPMLTAHSEFGLGDRRRPQAIVMIDPLLARWGLDLLFDEEQQAGERMEAFDTGTVRSGPVNLPGRLAAREDFPTAMEACWIAANSLTANCSIGAGEVLVVADAALLEEPDDGNLTGREEAFDHLLGSLSWPG